MKIGPHDYNTTEWDGRAGIIKAFNCGPGPLQAALPQAYTFYRKFMGDWTNADGAWVAQQVVAAIGGFVPSAVELYVGPPQDQIDALCTQVEQAATWLHSQGHALAAFSWYTGQPEPVVWQTVAARGWCGLDPRIDFISVQEYTANGTINDPVNVGRFKSIIDAGWTGRIAILEGGYDSCGQPGCGWQSALTLDQFYAYLNDYAKLIAAYPQVVGMTVFNAPGWPSFEFHDPNKIFNYQENDMPYSVGPGFAQWLTANGKEAASDEFYIAGDQVSAALAKQGTNATDLLIYSKDTNQVKSLPLT